MDALKGMDLTELSDSPLITPKDGGSLNPVIKPAANAEEINTASTPSASGATKKDGANKGWRERLDGLRKQRNLEK